jgi:hypothetical protein
MVAATRKSLNFSLSLKEGQTPPETGTRVLVVKVTWSHHPDDSNQGASRVIVPVPRPRTLLSPCETRTYTAMANDVWDLCHARRKKSKKSDLWVRFLMKQCAQKRRSPGIDWLYEPIEQVFLKCTLRWQKRSRSPGIRFRVLYPILFSVSGIRFRLLLQAGDCAFSVPRTSLPELLSKRKGSRRSTRSSSVQVILSQH